MGWAGGGGGSFPFFSLFVPFFTSLPAYFFICLFLSFFSFYLFVLSFCLSFYFFFIFLAPTFKLFRVMLVNKLPLHFIFLHCQTRCSGGVPVFRGVPVFPDVPVFRCSGVPW